jgi:hypothetical protein
MLINRRFFVGPMSLIKSITRWRAPTIYIPQQTPSTCPHSQGVRGNTKENTAMHAVMLKEPRPDALALSGSVG